MQKRIAIVDLDLCKPEACNHLCVKVCPKNRAGEDCVVVKENNKPGIDENICIGCGICVNKCPMHSISVINLPAELTEAPSHRYGSNQFALFRLPVPKKETVVSLIGQNGTGKTTAIKILAGKMKPNLGTPGRDVPWDEIMERFKGNELQEYLTGLKDGRITAAYKPQNIEEIPKLWSGKALGMIKKLGDPERALSLVKEMGVESILDKDVATMSGGELQMLALVTAMSIRADLYFFDEPSSYLDVSQRLKAARQIRKLAGEAMVLAVEHDLAVADYLADQVQILYGRPGCFGVISNTYGVRRGINTYLEGFIREENMRFRDDAVYFSRTAKVSGKKKKLLEFPAFGKKLGGFSLATEGGTLYKGEILGILGPNATGKTTFIRMLTGEVKSDEGEALRLKLSYKPQEISVDENDAELTVRLFLGREADTGSSGLKRVVRVLQLERLMEKRLSTLSGGELQSVLIANALSREFEVLLLDEPTAFLDVEQRLRVGKIIREVIESSDAVGFVIDHDLQILDALSDRLMVFSGERGRNGHGHAPSDLREGMNLFLKGMGITFRRDPTTGRARANKEGSVLDREQKEKGEHFYE